MIEIDTSGADILQLPVKPKEPIGELFLAPAPQPCCHFPPAFFVDPDAGKCFCRRCKGEVAPMFVLEQLMKQESRWNRTREAYLGEMKRLDERSRTKCQHCGKTTKISRA
jgi:hypothetical protein